MNHLLHLKANGQPLIALFAVLAFPALMLTVGAILHRIEKR